VAVVVSRHSLCPAAAAAATAQFVAEGHLRWDSLGEYLAIAVSLEDLGEKTNNARAKLLGETLTAATASVLDNRLSPSRKVLLPLHSQHSCGRSVRT
jgi:monomeric isocitrate dehydrogenase